jgi:Leucine-rich repeat (LRR) protein
LEALRNLRENVPGLSQKLQPQPPIDHSGMIWADTTNEWGINLDGAPPETPQQPVEPTFPDSDVRYWKRIATFTTTGELHTLSLGGQRLHRITDATVLVQPALLESVVIVDLANSDIQLDILCEILKSARKIQQLFLGGNSLKSQGLDTLAPLIREMPSLQVLGLQYNDIEATDSLAALQQISKLHLEGNPLGDAGAAALVLSNCQELYLGQCQIRQAGAMSLANQLKGSRLESLFLEGNFIQDAGADAFRQALLAGGHVLTKLYVDNNGLSKENAIALGAAVNSATVIGPSAFFSNE